jgi:hypothetical protein
MAQEKGFFGSVFDLSFSTFVTIRLVRFLYVLTLAFLVLAYVLIAIGLFAADGEQAVSIGVDGSLETEESGGGNTVLGVLWLLFLGPLALLFYTLLYRVFFELIVVVFRIYENTSDQLALTRSAAGPGEPPA